MINWLVKFLEGRSQGASRQREQQDTAAATRAPVADAPQASEENMDGLSLIVGLGNPGDKYEQTRHNAGFWFVDELARDYGATLKPETKFTADIAKCQIGDRAVWLMKPQTFMNLSGKSVGPFARFYKIAPENILVVHDELDFPAGVARVKFGGGAGGHNGITDIDFYRLRMGVDRPGDPAKVESWVLKRPSKEDDQKIRDAMYECARHTRDLVDGRFEDAMTSIHTNLKLPAKTKSQG